MKNYNQIYQTLLRGNNVQTSMEKNTLILLGFLLKNTKSEVSYVTLTHKTRITMSTTNKPGIYMSNNKLTTESICH